MAGLIQSGLFKGVGEAMSTYGLSTLQARERAVLEEDRQARELSYRRERDRDANDARVEAARIAADARLEAAGARAGGKGAGMVGGALDARQRTMLELGDTIPEGEAWFKAITTGDTSGIGEEVPLPGPVEEGQKPLSGRKLPDDFAELRRAKVARLKEIEDEHRLGKDYKDVAEGRRTELGNVVGRGMVSGAMGTEQAGEQIAALEGKTVDPETAEAKRRALEARAERDRAAADKDKRTDPNLRSAPRAGGAGGAGGSGSLDEKSIRKQVETMTSKIATLRSQQAKEEAKALGERSKAGVRDSYRNQISALEAERSVLESRLAKAARPADNRAPEGALKKGESRAYGTSRATRLD
jgi:hypothetical protein